MLSLKGRKKDEKDIFEFVPAHRAKSIPTRSTSFLTGIEKHEVFMNDEKVL